MKIKSDVQLNSTDIRIVDDVAYIYIYLNETKIIVDSEQPYECYEYDYNEIVGRLDELNIEEIKKNPNKYLNYQVPQKLTFEETQMEFNMDADYRLSKLELGI